VSSQQRLDVGFVVGAGTGHFVMNRRNLGKLSGVYFWTKSTEVLVPVCGLKVLGCRPTTASKRAS